MAKEAVDDVMADVQEYASAWALVGSQFDNGDMLGDAEEMKTQLRAKIARLLRHSSAPSGEVAK